MKKHIKLICGLVCLAAFVVWVQGATLLTFAVNVPSGLASVSNTTSTSTSGTPFYVQQNVDYVFQPNFQCVSNGISNVVFGLDLWDGSNAWSSTAPVKFTSVAKGGTNVSDWQIVRATNFIGAYQARLGYVSTTQTNAVQLNSMGAAAFQ